MTDTPKCDICGREMVVHEGILINGAIFYCPATPDQHRIAELEKQAAELEAEIEARGPVAVTKRMTPEGDRIAELVRLIGQPSPGSHPDEWYPRAASWHQERANWAAEVERLKAWGAKMKESAEATEGRCEVLADSMNETDAKLAEYEAKVKELESQLRAREADVLALRSYIESNRCAHENRYRVGAIGTICDDCGTRWADDEGGFVPDRLPSVLSNTSATAQEITQKIERRALEMGWERFSALEREQKESGIRYTYKQALAQARAAILGEKNP